MNTKISFFGSLADRLGRQAELELPARGCTVAELRRLLAERDDLFASSLGQAGVRVSVDQQMARDGDPVRPGQEVSFFPILSGG